MYAPNSPAQAHAWRRRTAAVFAAVGALIFSSGIVMLTAPAANAADRVGVCHRTGGDSHPYTFIRVAANSTALQAHRDHRVEDDGVNPGEDKYWKSAGTWNGMTHVAGDFKPDYIQGDDPEMPDDMDAARNWCLNSEDTVTVTLAELGITPVGACGTYGSIAKPQDTEYVVYTINTSSWSHLSGTAIVTATLQASADGFKGNTNGWDVADDERSATYSVDLGQHTDCPTGTLATPQVTVIDTCDELGSITEPVSNDVSYTIDGGENWSVTEGVHTVTATLVAPATAFANAPAGWVINGSTATYSVDLGAFVKCSDGNPATAVTPLAPKWVEATCDTNPSVTYTQVAGVAYDTTGDVAPGKTATVTASTVGNHVFADGVTTSWSHTFDAKPSGADCDEPTVPTEEPLEVTPNYPSVKPATCSRNGLLTVPSQPDGVLMAQLGSVPGDVSFIFTPATGYVFPEGTDTDVTVTVGAKLSGTDCILGEESHQPKPTKSKPKPRDRGPVVLGTQAAVPTAVDAGLSGLPTTSASMTSSPQLAQALVAGGLLMLVAGGSMGLGRRSRGAHES